MYRFHHLIITDIYIIVIKRFKKGKLNFSIINSFVNIHNGELPYHYKLYPAFPNPFNPTTNIIYTLSNHGEYSINIYNINGMLIKNLVSDFGTPGEYKVMWDSCDNYGQKVASGIYFYHLSTLSNITKNKMVLVK